MCTFRGIPCRFVNLLHAAVCLCYYSSIELPSARVIVGLLESTLDVGLLKDKKQENRLFDYMDQFIYNLIILASIEE